MARFVRYDRCPSCVERGNDTRGDNLGVYDDGGSHCFSCGYHRFPRGYWPHRVDDDVKENAALLPFDFTREVPTTAWKWLLQYGLPYSYWKAHCGYSPKDQRLVFTVGTPLQFSIGRYVGEPTDGQRVPRKWHCYGDSHKYTEVVNRGASENVALVEDLISAHKIAAAGYTAVPLFGTRIHPCHLYYLRGVEGSITLWLDKDQEGLVKKQASWLQMMTGKPVKVLTTDKDPKTYSVEKIKELLNDV
jgi:hypothetical protein